MRTTSFRVLCLLLLAVLDWNFVPLLAAPTTASSSSAVYQEWTDTGRQRELPIKLYLPHGAPPYPTVIFSHGLGGSREAATYLGNYWSQHGYLCLFVQHPGSDTSVWRSAIGQGRQAMLKRMKEAANGKNLIDRAQDITFAIDELQRLNQTDPQLKGLIDLNRIAVAGHSFGAGTSLAVAGQTFAGMGAAYKDDRIKAAIYLCPPVRGGKANPKRTYGSINIPGLLLTGTEDNSPIGETRAEDRRVPYDGIQSPHQYLINFFGADHGVFGGRAGRQPQPGDARIQQMVDVVTTRFLDATLKGDPAAWRWLNSNEMKNFLGQSATLERK